MSETAPTTRVRDEASIVPDVSRSSPFSLVADIDGLVSATASSPRPLIPLEVRAVTTSPRLPVSSVADEASMTPVVLPSRAFRSRTASVESDKTAAAPPSPLMPEDEKAVATSARAPVTVVTRDASMTSACATSRALRALAATVPFRVPLTVQLTLAGVLSSPSVTW